jgi:hypothetical protein
VRAVGVGEREPDVGALGSLVGDELHRRVGQQWLKLLYRIKATRLRRAARTRYGLRPRAHADEDRTAKSREPRTILRPGP